MNQDFEAFARKVMKAADAASVVSFDVFDTLIMRACSPRFAFVAASREASSATGVPLRRALELRVAAERNCGSRTAASGGDHETTLVDICEEWARLLGAEANAGLARRLLDAELSSEAALTFAAPGMPDVVRRVRDAGKRVVAVSDMYIGADGVRRLLDGAGYSELFDAVYVSGDIGVSKASGRLFRHVLEAERVVPESVVHVGDNAHSDGFRASELGIVSILVGRDGAERRTRRCEADLARVWGDDHGRAFAAHRMGEEMLGPGRTDRVAAALAPVYCYYVLALAERAAARGVDSVWFFAREGFLLKRLYEMVAASVPGAPPAGYLEVSRATVFAASISHYGLREIALSFLNTGDGTIADLLAPFKLAREDVAALCVKYGFCGPDDRFGKSINWNPMTDLRFHRLVGDPVLHAAIAGESAQRLKELREYLDRVGFLSRKSVMVADVGWGGQIQEGLEMALARMPEAPELHGAYMVLRDSGAMRRRAGMSAEGILYDSSVDGWAESSPLISVDPLEDACRAPHGSVEGYDNGRPRTVADDRRSRMEEAASDPALAALQASILVYARWWMAYVSSTGTTSESVRPFAVSCAARFARFPRRYEAEFFADFVHALNFGSDLAVKEILPSGVLSALRAVQKARWKEGAAVRVGGSILQILLAIKRLRLVLSEKVDMPASQSASDRVESGRPVPVSELERAAWIRHEHLKMSADPALATPVERQSVLGLWDLMLLNLYDAVQRRRGAGSCVVPLHAAISMRTKRRRPSVVRRAARRLKAVWSAA